MTTTIMPNDFPGDTENQTSVDLSKLSLSNVMIHPVSIRMPDVHLRCNFVDAKVDLILASIYRQGGLSAFLRDAILTVLRKLYYDHQLPGPTNVRSITLFLDHMEGVAYTTGSQIDPEHKELHFSISYFTRPELVADQVRMDEELRGVLVHELVHCLQYNALGSAPGGFIEGIADWVRYRAQLSPPHWRQQTRPGKESKWDDGYQHTAFFLLWLDHKYGPRTTITLNKACEGRKWSDQFFEDVTGTKLTELWTDYCADDEWQPY